MFNLINKLIDFIGKMYYIGFPKTIGLINYFKKNQ